MELVSQPKKAISLVLCAWLFFTGALAIAHQLGPRMPVPVLLLFQNTMSMLFIIPWMIGEDVSVWKPPNIRLLLLRTFAGYLNFAFLFLALQSAPLTEVLLLGNSAPFFIPLIIWLWRGIGLSWKLWLGIIVGFIGIALILQPAGHLLNIGALFALAAAFSFSISMIAQRRLLKRASDKSILFYYFAIATLVSLPFAIALWKPLSTTDLLWLFSMGILSGIGQLLFLKALQYEKPSLLSPFNYSSIVYAALLDWFIWKQVLSPIGIIGIIVVVTGGLMTMRAAHIEPPAN